jgi:sugar (glycoside-pentoside-hexuronide) transporter
MDKHAVRNRYAFGLGTIGRDMVYALVSMYLIFYLTDILDLPNSILWWLNFILMGGRIFDAVNDPFMGVIVDNTRTRFGKFKPWIASGALLTGLAVILLFTDFGISGPGYVVLFAFSYLFWEVSYTANDISYWSMLPSLSVSQKEREKIGAFAKICANVGLFTVVAGIVPITTALGQAYGSMKTAYTVFAAALAVIMCIGQAVTLFGVKEHKELYQHESSTSLKGMVKAIFQNDQLLFVAVSMSLFMIGYMTTTSFGLYFFKYAYGDEGMYSIFAVILGISQITALAAFPLFSRRFNRKSMYSAATAMMVAGYVLFFFSPMDMLYIGASGILIFIGQAFIQLLMLMFLADTVEYGQWKLGKRNDSVTFSLQPFINKMGGALASGIVGTTVILSGITDAARPSDVSPEGLMMMKAAMLILPLILILISYLLYSKKYRIDEVMYEQILEDLRGRGGISL